MSSRNNKNNRSKKIDATGSNKLISKDKHCTNGNDKVLEGGKNATNPNTIAEKFKEVQKKHIQAAKKHIENYESSSEEELENDSLLESVFKSYAGDKNQLQKTQEFLENVFQSGAATCLICIATVKRTDYVIIILVA